MPQATIDISNPETAPLFEGVAVGDLLDVQLRVEGVSPKQLKVYVEGVETAEVEEVEEGMMEGAAPEMAEAATSPVDRMVAAAAV